MDMSLSGRAAALAAALVFGVPANGAGGGDAGPIMKASSKVPSAASVQHLEERFGPSPDGRVLVVSVAAQRLYLFHEGRLQAEWPVSTSKYGIGNQQGSNKTPLGTHRVAEKYGAGAPAGTLFRARRNTGRLVSIIEDDRAAPDDYVTTRILWLEGLEPGVNKGAGIDSFERYIYIHGTAEEGRIGRPASHGCIRMRNADVIELFEQVPIGTLVDVRAQ